MRRLILSLAFLTPSIFASSGSGFDVMQFVPLLLIFVIFYFLILRPQQKKARNHQEMVKALHRGDKVLTSGGIIGSVDKVISDTEVSVEIADGVKVRVLKSTIADLVAKTQPAVEKTSPVAAQSKEIVAKTDSADSKKTATKTKTPVKAVTAKKPAPKKK